MFYQAAGLAPSRNKYSCLGRAGQTSLPNSFPLQSFLYKPNCLVKMPSHRKATAFPLISVSSGPKSLPKIILQPGRRIYGVRFGPEVVWDCRVFGKHSSCSWGSLAAGMSCRLSAAFPGSVTKKYNIPCFPCASKSYSMFCQCPPLFKAPPGSCWGHYFSPSFIGSGGFFLILKRAPMDRE